MPRPRNGLADPSSASASLMLGSRHRYQYGFNGVLDRADYGSDYCEHVWDAAGNRVGLTFSGTSSYAFVCDITAGVPAFLPMGRDLHSRARRDQENFRCLGAPLSRNWCCGDAIA